MLTYFPVIIISGVFGSISEPHWLFTIGGMLAAIGVFRWEPRRPTQRRAARTLP